MVRSIVRCISFLSMLAGFVHKNMFDRPTHANEGEVNCAN